MFTMNFWFMENQLPHKGMVKFAYFNQDTTVTIAVDNRLYAAGIAKCSPTDYPIFSLETGLRVACKNALNIGNQTTSHNRAVYHGIRSAIETHKRVSKRV